MSLTLKLYRGPQQQPCGASHGVSIPKSDVSKTPLNAQMVQSGGPSYFPSLSVSKNPPSKDGWLCLKRTHNAAMH